ncbi:helix-hairpin-helix domain-containing protein [Echinicola marina]|uniref:ComEA family DNA-binding protein n=1 Tax=Echinicola marina TaxID=2859768 RepID=UPI001CF6D957|nr:helix-hairpin-helix domain-containing protein [Echinicola marina]UCS95603.1 helix-hairpin-helix domain-containing protein [Echinicola marina]
MSFLKKILINILLATLLTLLSNFSKAQSNEDFDVEAFAEELFATQDEDLNYEMLYENLLQIYLNPLDLNQCNADELQSLYILSPLQVHNFMRHRDTFGKILSIYELQSIPDFNVSIIKKLMPFISINPNTGQKVTNLPQRMFTEKTAYFIYRVKTNLETRKGFTPPDTLGNGRLTSRYLGSPESQYLRFRTQHSKDFSFGFTLDKDAGESFQWKPRTQQYGFNFFSYHLSLYNKGNWKTITIGDYQAQFGQGLIFGAGFSVGKGAETITTTRRSSTGIKPYTSAMESGYFRGLSATYAKGNLEGSIILSHVHRDASLEWPDSTNERSKYIKSLPESGYHRTPTEIAQKANSWEQNLGGNLSYISTNKNLQIGINSLATKFKYPYLRQSQIYNAFEFRGQFNHIHSAYFSFNHQNHFLFGEGAISKSSGKAFVLGIMSSLNEHLDLVFHIRDFGRKFHSFYGNAFSEGSRPINEKGIYLGLHYQPKRNWKWSGYIDQFRFPWLKYRSYSASSGYEWLQRITYSNRKKLSIYFQIREEQKDRNITANMNEMPAYQIATGKKRNFTLNLDQNIGKNYSTRTRIQWSSFDFDEKKTTGFAIAQDFNAAFGKWKYSGRIALFDTEDYDNRQYIYEKNVLWAFSIPSYYGQGMRYYLLSQFKASRKLNIWLRWSRSIYTDRETIGSGLQEVKGNTLSDITFQVRYQFNK